MLKLDGKQFGNLTVKEYAYSKNKKTYWWCQCTCGSNPKVLLGVNLTRGDTKSCGCLRKAIHSELPYYWIYRILIRFIRQRKYHDFTNDVMSYEEFLTFTKIDKCHYCNESIIWSEHTTYRDEYIGSGKTKNINRKYNLDRKDNSKGYTKDNCVVCCSLCNYVKGRHLTYEEMLLVGETISEVHKKRKAASEK